MNRISALAYYAKCESDHRNPPIYEDILSLERDGLLTATSVGWGHCCIKITPKGRAELDKIDERE